MAKETVYNNTLVSGAADETLTYTRYIKDESSGKSTKELLDEKVNKTDQLGTTQIADKAVTTEKLENESVTTDKLDSASVTTDKVADANITTSKLADSSVETEKINNKAVTTDKLNDGAVDNSKLSPNSVTSEKIKDESIITEKLNDRAVTTEKVEEKAITNQKLGNQSVDGRVVREASLETKHFANGSVTTEKIKDSSVTNEKVADDTLGIEKFDPELRKTIQAATGLPEDLSQMIQDVDKSVKQLKEKDTDLQSQINDKQQQITANDDDISLLQTRSTQMEEAIKSISASGGASQASAVTYENTESGLDSVTAQGAIDELARKKFNKENISQEFGDSKDKVVSQFALPFREIESPEFINAIVDSEDHFLFGIQLDGSIEWGKGIPAPIRKKFEEIVSAASDNKLEFTSKINELVESLSSIKRFNIIDLKRKKISILGDSLSTFKGYIPEGNYIYYPNDNNDVTSVEQTWWYKLIQETNATLEVNNSSSGSKVSGGVANYSYTERYTNLGNPDYIIIHGGTNDIWQNVPVGTLHFESKDEELNINEFADAYDLMIRRILKLYPHANIMLVVPAAVSDEYANVINTIAQHYDVIGVTVLKDYNISLYSGHYQVAGMETVKEAVRESLFINKNVDKIRGMSLIEDEVKESFRVIENEEFIHAVIDSEDRLLFAIYRDSGKPYFPLNEMYHVEQNEEFFAVWLDADNRVVAGIRRDGEIIGEIHAVNALKQVISQLQSDIASLQEKVGAIDTNLKDLLDIFSLKENTEYMAVETDAEGKVLSATNADGSHYIHNAKSETIPEEFSHIEDPEKRMEIVADADGKVISWRDSNGRKHEHDMDIANLDVSNLNLKGNSVNNIQDALIANGFDVKAPIDWSESNFIQIPEPRFAIINVSNIDSMPTTKTQNKKAFLEFWDMQGNYFKKHAILNAQGRSSMSLPKKNIAIDLCDDEWVGDATPKLRIGNWVPQDSFHMKANYTDFFRGVGTVTYKLYEEIVNTRGVFEDRPWKKALIDIDKIGTSTKSIGNPYVGNFNLLTDTGALCFPEGFPVACYLNGLFYGIFTWQLKKHRDNYHMNKATAEHVHLDGIVNKDYFWGGTIDWSQFEVRNPKNLYAIGGNKYDADIKQEEIAGDAEVNAWIALGKLPDDTVISSKIKKNLQLTAKVKKYILAFSQFLTEVKAAASTYESSSKTSSDLDAFKAVFEKYFDTDNVIDYLIISDISNNYDGIWGNNWQLFTYDGKKWWIGLYDVDGTWGNHYTGSKIVNVLTGHSSGSMDMPFGYIIKYYDKELKARYEELANQGIISYNHISAMLRNFTLKIGTSFYDDEYSKWKDSPCASDSIVRNDYWELLLDEHGNPQTDSSESFDARTTYRVGDVVSFGLNENMGFYKFKCIKPNIALNSNTPHAISTFSPIKEFRHADNLYRLEKWVRQSLINMDKLYEYTRK